MCIYSINFSVPKKVLVLVPMFAAQAIGEKIKEIALKIWNMLPSPLSAKSEKIEPARFEVLPAEDELDDDYLSFSEDDDDFETADDGFEELKRKQQEAKAKAERTAAKIVENPTAYVAKKAGKAAAKIEPNLRNPVQTAINLLADIDQIGGKPKTVIEEAAKGGLPGLRIGGSLSIFFQFIQLVNLIGEEARNKFIDELKDGLPVALKEIQESLGDNFSAKMKKPVGMEQVLPDILNMLVSCCTQKELTVAAIQSMRRAIGGLLGVEIRSPLQVETKEALIAHTISYVLAIVLLMAREEVNVARELAKLDDPKKTSFSDAELRAYLVPGSIAFTILKDLSPNGGILDAGFAIHGNPWFANWFLSNNTDPWMPQKIAKWTVRQMQNRLIPKDLRPLYANLGLLEYDSLEGNFHIAKLNLTNDNSLTWDKLCGYLRTINEMGAAFGTPPMVPAELMKKKTLKKAKALLLERAELIHAKMCSGKSDIEMKFEESAGIYQRKKSDQSQAPLTFEEATPIRVFAEALGVMDHGLTEDAFKNEQERKEKLLLAKAAIAKINLAKFKRLQRIEIVKGEYNNRRKAEARKQLKNVLQEFLHGPLFTNIGNLNRQKVMIRGIYDFVAGVEGVELNPVLGQILPMVAEYAPKGLELLKSNNEGEGEGE